jgi:hypothetical protein
MKQLMSLVSILQLCVLEVMARWWSFARFRQSCLPRYIFLDNHYRFDFFTRPTQIKNEIGITITVDRFITPEINFFASS